MRPIIAAMLILVIAGTSEARCRVRCRPCNQYVQATPVDPVFTAAYQSSVTRSVTVTRECNGPFCTKPK